VILYVDKTSPVDPAGERIEFDIYIRTYGEISQTYFNFGAEKTLEGEEADQFLKLIRLKS